MAISESERRELHEAVERGLGARAADLLLAMNEPELPFVLRAEMAEVRGEMSALRTELKTEMAGLRTELKTEMAGLRTEMADLRAELKTEMAGLRTELRTEMADLRTEFKSEMATQYGRVVVANIGSMIGLAGLVLAAGALI